MLNWNDAVRSGESSIEQRPDTRICVVQRISDGLKECEETVVRRRANSMIHPGLAESYSGFLDSCEGFLGNLSPLGNL